MPASRNGALDFYLLSLAISLRRLVPSMSSTKEVVPSAVEAGSEVFRFLGGIPRGCFCVK